MKTYRDLLDVLSKLSEEQLNTEVKFLAVGYPEGEAPQMECDEVFMVRCVTRTSTSTRMSWRRMTTAYISAAG